MIFVIPNGSMDLSLTFRLYKCVFMQHILKILLKQLIWLNRCEHEVVY